MPHLPEQLRRWLQERQLPSPSDAPGQLNEDRQRRRTLLLQALALPALSVLSFAQQSSSQEYSPQELLEMYLVQIAPLQKAALEATQDQTFFDRFQVSLANQQEDLEIFFPMYFAAQEKYGIPWEYFWVMHEHETTASRHPNPGRAGYLGAMQRSPDAYPLQNVIDASAGLEFLAKLPQRYHPPGYRTYDYQEILFAAWKVRSDADDLLKAHDLSELEAIEQAQYEYCAEANATLRISDFREVRRALLKHEISQSL